MVVNMGTGRQIKRLRLKARLSAEKAAALMNIDADRLRKWEARDLEPRENDAKKLEEFFGVELDKLEELESFNFFHKVPFDSNEPVAPYRRDKTKDDPDREGIDFIDISAQAGYPKKITDPMFKSSLKKIFIPGMPYRGEDFRIWEVEGNSMEPTFKEGYHLLTEKVEPEFWTRAKQFHAHVIVTAEDVLLKRIAYSKTKPDHWVLHSDNELYPEFLFPIELVKELWFVRRKMDWEMAPPKKFDSEL